MHPICATCKHKNTNNKLCFIGFDQITGKKQWAECSTIGCERFSKYLRRLRRKRK